MISQPLHSYRYMAWEYVADFGIGPAYQMGYYFRTAENAVTALTSWGQSGWYFPSFDIAKENFQTPAGAAAIGYRVINRKRYYSAHKPDVLVAHSTESPSADPHAQ